MPDVIKIQKRVLTKPPKVTLKYIKSFFVGLFEGDGCITTQKTSTLKSRPVLTLELKRLPENISMLKQISSFIGGHVSRSRQGNRVFVKWQAVSKADVANCLRIFRKYPLLTSRKRLRLEHLQRCGLNTGWEFHLKTRDQRYDKQKEMVEIVNKSFVIPPYFGPWLSGFIEAEGCFHSQSSFGFSVSQNTDWYILNAIKTYFDSHHKLSVHRQTNQRYSGTHYVIQMCGFKVISLIIAHFKQ